MAARPVRHHDQRRRPDTGYDPLTFTANANGSTISTATLKTQLDAGNSVTVSTGGAAGGAGGQHHDGQRHTVGDRHQPRGADR
jgi:hypothetical protein